MDSLDLSSRWNLIGHPVRVTLRRGSKLAMLCGNVYTIDPVEGHLIIVQFEDLQIVGVHWIQPDAIEALNVIEVEQGLSCLPYSSDLVQGFYHLFKNYEGLNDSKDLLKRKQAVMDYLKKNNIEIEECPDGSLRIFGSVILEAPYNAENCMCDNGIVLQRIRKIIENVK